MEEQKKNRKEQKKSSNGRASGSRRRAKWTKESAAPRSKAAMNESAFGHGLPQVQGVYQIF